MFSPDGRWIAYMSDESGRFEVYVRPFPGPGGRTQVSIEGGEYPVWSRAQPELLYSTRDQYIMAVRYAIEADSFRADKPRRWSETRFTPRFRSSFALHPDGQRVAVAVGAEAPAPPAVDSFEIAFNLLEDLRRLAPPAGR